MAKGRILPPRKNIAKTVKSIIKQGPKILPKTIMTKGKSQSFVKQVQQSKIPKPSQNRRGRIKSNDEMDLTR